MSDEEEKAFNSKYASVLHDLAVQMAKAIPEHNRTTHPQVGTISINFALPEYDNIVLTVDLAPDEYNVTDINEQANRMDEDVRQIFRPSTDG
jgi:hypothetical protein